jgi:hypothetical protein
MHMQFAVVDVDDVLLATGGASQLAEQAMVTPLMQHLGQPHATAVQHEFTRALHILTQQLRSAAATPRAAYHALRNRIAWWQRGLTDAGCEVKEWSRHTLVACALEACGLPVTRTVVHAVADHYWAAIAQHATVFPDARARLQQLRTAGVAVHLATGSDGCLTFHDTRQTFTYAPEEAVCRKLARLHGLTALGCGPDNISIGDPIGKPHHEFFRAVLQHFSDAIGQEVELARTVAIGDSLTNDIVPLLGLGAACGVWLLRERSVFGDQQRWQHPQVTVVNTLDAGEVHQLFCTA